MASLKKVVRPSALRAALEAARIPLSVDSYQPGAVIFRQGDPAESVMYLESGRVRLVVAASSGKEAICGLLEAGAFLGEDVLAGRVDRRETAVTMAATSLLVISAPDMIRLVHNQPAIADHFITRIIARNIHLEADLVAQMLSSSEQRLARTLMELAGCGQGSADRCALPHISQEIIAEIVGTTRSRVNVFMGRFKKLGFIAESHGELQVTRSLRHVIDDGGSQDGVSQREHPGLATAS